MKNKYLLIGIILLLAAVFRFSNLTAVDLHSDDATYSFRALGWVDYLGSGQTTPLQWFTKIPWWSGLSFHDAPPLVFTIQHVFFILFGDNDFAARLPFALAGVIAVFLVYWIIKKNKDERTGLIAALIFSVLSYAVWGSRIGYLEGIEILFIMLSFGAFLSYLNKSNSAKYLYYWGIFAALALLCKYTALFIFPAAIFYLIIKDRSLFRSKLFWRQILKTVIIIILILSPIIIYNAMVYKTRGHFDAALSSIVGMHPQDFPSIAARSVNSNVFGNLLNAFSVFKNAVSIPMLILLIIAFVCLFIKVFNKKSGDLEKFLVTNSIFLLAMFVFSSASERFLTIAVPFIVMAIALFVADVLDFSLVWGGAAVRNVFLFVFVIFLCFEVFYSVNTNILIAPIGDASVFYSPYKFFDMGYGRLEEYMRQEIVPKDIYIHDTRGELSQAKLSWKDLTGESVTFYDDRINWFAYIWYVQKYQVYYKQVMLPVSFEISNPNLMSEMNKIGATKFYFIYVMDTAAMDPVKIGNGLEGADKGLEHFRDILDKNGAPYEEIKNNMGDTIFKVYKVTAN